MIAEVLRAATRLVIRILIIARRMTAYQLVLLLTLVMGRVNVVILMVIVQPRRHDKNELRCVLWVFKCRNNFCGVAFRFDLFKDFGDFTILVNDKSSTGNTHIFPAIH